MTENREASLSTRIDNTNRKLDQIERTNRRRLVATLLLVGLLAVAVVNQWVDRRADNAAEDRAEARAAVEGAERRQSICDAFEGFTDGLAALSTPATPEEAERRRQLTAAFKADLFNNRLAPLHCNQAEEAQ